MFLVFSQFFFLSQAVLNGHTLLEVSSLGIQRIRNDLLIQLLLPESSNHFHFKTVHHRLQTCSVSDSKSLTHTHIHSRAYTSTPFIYPPSWPTYIHMAASLMLWSEVSQNPLGSWRRVAKGFRRTWPRPNVRWGC